MRIALTRGVLAASVLLATAAGTAALAPGGAGAAGGGTTTVLGRQADGWKYQEIAFGELDGFQSPRFDDSAFATGRAGFGSTDGTCSFNASPPVHTAWTGTDDELVRHAFDVPAGTTSIHITGDIDNDADVYVNGALVQHVVDGNCHTGGIDVTVAANALNAYGSNLLAIRARNEGGPAFVDAQVTADYTAPRPTVSALSPSSGTTAGGTTVTITGSGFTSAKKVLFGANTASYVVVSDTEIDATSPAHARGTVKVRVKTAGGLSAKGRANRYTFVGSTPQLRRGK